MPPKRKAQGAQGDSGRKTKKSRSKKDADQESEGEEEIISEPKYDLSVFADFKLEVPALKAEMVFCGGSDWDLTGRKSVPVGVSGKGGRNIYEPRRMEPVKGKQFARVVSGSCACHSVAIDPEGQAYTWGRNEKSQLGLGDSTRRDSPTLVDGLKDVTIVDAACGRNHTVFLSDRGVVYAAGDNKMGQLGLGMQSNSVPSPTKIAYDGPPIKRVACGADFTMIVNVMGVVYSMGCPEYGQLGHNTDGKYLKRANKVDFSCETRPRRIPLFIDKNRDGSIVPMTDTYITEIACGINHTVALDRNKRVFTWGFGGYGRLGHSEPKDEMIPRLVKVFDGPARGATMVAAGGTYSLAVHVHGSLMMWGNNKPAGEANMYPKVMQDLNGWQIRSIGCSNRSIVIAADDSLVSWGPSPTYGELGYGEGRKSSTRPAEVKTIHGAYVQQVTCGMGHTLLLLRNDSEDDQAIIDKISSFTP